jgi:hypothetical protein
MAIFNSYVKLPEGTSRMFPEIKNTGFPRFGDLVTGGHLIVTVALVCRVFLHIPAPSHDVTFDQPSGGTYFGRPKIGSHLRSLSLLILVTPLNPIKPY